MRHSAHDIGDERAVGVEKVESTRCVLVGHQTLGGELTKHVCLSMRCVMAVYDERRWKEEKITLDTHTSDTSRSAISTCHTRYHDRV